MSQTVKENNFSLSDVKVSVIIPVYNVESYVEACISSVLNQTLKEIEIICIDDGSTDNSCSIIEKYQANDDRVKLFHKENGGLSSARNYGMKVATGKYIFLLDSDDYIAPNALEVLYIRAEKDNLEVCDFNATAFFETEQDKINHSNYIDYYKRNAEYHGVYTGLSFLCEMLKNKDYKPSAWLHLINRQYYVDNNIYFYEGIIHEDNEFSYNLLKKANRAGYIPEVLYNRRIHSDSIITTAKSSKNVYGLFVAYLEMLNDLLNNNIPESETLNIELLIKNLSNSIFDVYRKIDDKNMDSVFTSNFSNKILFNVLFVNVFKHMQAELEKKEKEKNSSISWKIGRFVTFIPRKIKKLLINDGGIKK